MSSIDDPLVLETGEKTTLRQLATAGRLTLRQSDSYRPDPKSEARIALWADVGPRRGWEITEKTYAELKALGVTEEPLIGSTKNR